MPIPGNPEPGAISEQQQVQQQLSINFSSSIPIKKRRFPIIQEKPPSPEEKLHSAEENPSISGDQDSKNKQEHKIPDEGVSLSNARDTDFPSNPNVSRSSLLAVKKEVTPTNTNLGQSNVDTFASKSLGAKPIIGLGPMDDLGNKNDILQSEKHSEPEVLESSMASQTANVKTEIVSGQTEGIHQHEFSSGKMDVELSLGLKEPLVQAPKHHNSEGVNPKSDKPDSSLLSLALHDKKLVLHEMNDKSMGNVTNLVSANRSNWDLNTTMDAWEGSTSSGAFVHRFFDIGGLSKTNSCQDDKSLLETADAVGLSTNKGKHVVDRYAFSFSNVSTQPSQQYKTDDSLGLKLAMPCIYTSKERSSLSDNLISTYISPNLNLKPVQLSVMNATVKSEPVDDNSKRDCSVGSSGSSSMELLKFSSVKRETASNNSLETVLPSSISSEKLVDCRSVKSEVVHKLNQEASKAEDAALQQSVGRVIQHQESCASSSSSLPVILMHQNPCTSRLPPCSELTTCGDLSTQSEQSIHGKVLHRNDVPNESIASVVSKHLSHDNEPSRPCMVESLGVVESDKLKLARIDEHMHELSQNSDVAAANDEEKMNISLGMLEENAFGSDFESQQNCAVDTICGKEDEEYEDGEVREPMQHSAGEDLIVERKHTEKLELVESDLRNFKPFVPSIEKNVFTPDFAGKDSVEKNQEETDSNQNKDCVGIIHEPYSEDSSQQKLFDEGLGVLDHEKRSVSVTPDKQSYLSGKVVQDSSGKEVLTDVRESPGKEILIDVPTNETHGIGIQQGDEAIEKVVEENCSGEDGSTLSKVEASLNGQDAVKDSNTVGNKSRIINLSRAVVTSPCKTKSIPNRLLTSRSEKERYSDLDREMQERGNRDEYYTGGSNKFVKDRANDQSFRNSRPNFMRGRGRMSGRFGSLRNEWNSDHDFLSETSYGPSDYRVMRRKHTSSISDVDLECNSYGVRQDGNAFSGNRRKMMNDEFPSARRTSFRRLSTGDRDGPMTRGMQVLHRIPRNMSPRRCSNEAGSDVIGLCHDDKFVRLSDDVVDPDYDRPQVMYDELDDQQLVRGNRNFTNIQRKGYPRIRSKSPARSRTRSPGPWSSPRRRSPSGLQEFTQHRSPALFRTGRMRSPDRCFRDEMVPRRRGSPSFVARHTNDMRDVDSGREHIHTRSADSNRRSSPGRVFPRNTRRGDVLDSREMEDGDEYMNGPLPSNKFHNDGGIDDRRKFIERRGPPRSFRPNFSSDNENFRFHMNDGPHRPYRFCPDAEGEFVERSNNIREREFDGRIKHQPMIVSRRNRNIEEQQQDGSYRPGVERVWLDDGFTGKRRRF